MKAPALLWPAWKRVAARLAAAPRLAVFSDFDGTLAPIVRHPDQARLPAATRAALRRLYRLPRLVVGVVSGRALGDLRRRVGLDGLYYIGTHGVEWSGPNGRHHAAVGAHFKTRIQELRQGLEAKLKRLPGIYVERKTASVAVHYRNAPAHAAERARHLVSWAAKNSPLPVRLLEGKKVLELLPPGAMDKGRAVIGLARRIGAGRRPLVVYLGDDVTDESVFQRLGADDLGIHIGRNERSRASYRLNSPAEARRFLARLAKVRG